MLKQKLHQLSKVVRTCFQRLGGLKSQKGVDSVVWRLEVCDHSAIRALWHLMLFEVLWLAVVTLISASIPTWASPLVCCQVTFPPWVSGFKFPSSHTDTGHIGLEDHSFLTWLCLKWHDLQWFYFQIRSHSEIPGVKTSTYLFGTRIQSLTEITG